MHDHKSLVDDDGNGGSGDGGGNEWQRKKNDMKRTDSR